MLNQDHVGRKYSATQPYEVSRAKIAEFARAIKDDNPAYFATEPIAPPTFAAVISAQAWEPFFADPELELKLSRTMHADQRFELNRPLKAGDEVLASLTIEKVRNRGLADFVTVRVELTTTAGEILGNAISTLLHTREETEEEVTA